MGTLREADVVAYEGLVRATARMYQGILSDDPDDVRQSLRVKVVQALLAYDPARSRMSERAYVFGCVRNRVKDLLKTEYRRRLPGGGARVLLHDDMTVFERAADGMEDEVLGRIDPERSPPLPATLTRLERRLVCLLMADLTPAEAADALGITCSRVVSVRAVVRRKMADWAPPRSAARPPSRSERHAAARTSATSRC